MSFASGPDRAAPDRGDYLIHEWEYGCHEREIELPAGYGSGVKATLANGQLAIRVLRGELTRPLAIHPSAA